MNLSTERKIMTVCIGMIDKNNHVWLGADSMVTIGDREKAYMGNESELDSKISKLKGPDTLYVAGTGSVVDQQVVALMPSPTGTHKTGEDPLSFESLATYFVPNVFKALSDRNRINNSETEGHRLLQTFIISTGKSLYALYCDGSLFPIKKFDTIGSGAEYALGSLKHSLNANKPAEFAIEEAVRAAAVSNPYVGGDIVIVDTTTGKKKIIKEKEGDQ